MYQNGVDIRTLQTVLGHTNLDTTKIYTHVNNDDVKFAAMNNPLAKIMPSKKIKAQTEQAEQTEITEPAVIPDDMI